MKSKIFSEILSKVTPEIESKVEQKTLEIMKANKENIYIDLSKLSEEEIKSLPNIIIESGEFIYEMTENMLNTGGLIDEDGDSSYILLSKSNKNEWIAYLESGCEDKTEISFSEFRQLFSKGEEVLQVENTVCCDNPDIRWNKVEISVGDKKGSYKDLSFNFCDNCGDTTNEELS